MISVRQNKTTGDNTGIEYKLFCFISADDALAVLDNFFIVKFHMGSSDV